MTMQNAFMSVRPRGASTSASPRLANAQLLRGMSQPPHFRTGQDDSYRPPIDVVVKQALQALSRCRNERDAPKRVRGA